MRQKRVRTVSRRGQVWKYFLCAMGLLLIIAVSFWLPRFIFGMQDYARVRGVETGNRDVLELARFDLEYERELSVRMRNFAEGLDGGKDYYAVSTEYKPGEVSMEDIDKAVYTSDLFWVEFTHEMTRGAFFYLFMDDGELRSCKKYVVFDGDFENGIAFSCLYAEIHSDTYGDMSILIDQEDYSIYYILCHANKFALEKLGYYDGLTYKRFYGGEGEEVAYTLAVYYSHYYQGSDDTWEGVESIYYDHSINESNASIAGGNALRFWMSATEEQMEYSVPISFGEERLHLELHLDQSENDKVHAKVGIEEIARLIPELNQE